MGLEAIRTSLLQSSNFRDIYQDFHKATIVDMNLQIFNNVK